jgi:hypothetical protein
MIARMQTIGGVLLAVAAGICLLSAGNAQEAAPAAVPARRASTATAAGAAPSAGVTSVRAATPYPSALEYAPQFATPQMQQLHAEEIEAANEAKRLVAVLSKGSESEQAEAKTKLREALVRQFDAQQKRRTQEIASIEERLGKLKETLQKRDGRDRRQAARSVDGCERRSCLGGNAVGTSCCYQQIPSAKQKLACNSLRAISRATG